MEERDYYEVLQLHPSADHTLIVQAYWHLARKFKMEMDRDAFAGHALEELNRSFSVLGDPDARGEYDRRRVSNSTSEVEPETKRVSIEVCFWNLPAWQGMLAATATIALAVAALASGVEPLLTLGLATIAVAAALLAMPRRIPFAQGPLRKRWRRKMNAAELERSTSQIIARWRETTEQPDGSLLLELSKDTTFPFDS